MTDSTSAHLRYYFIQGVMPIPTRPPLLAEDRWTGCEVNKATSQLIPELIEYDKIMKLHKAGAIVNNLQFIAVNNFDDYLKRRSEIEAREGFSGWHDNGVRWDGSETFSEVQF